MVQNAAVREYTKRCNTVENIHIHKVIGQYRETELSSSERPRNRLFYIMLLFPH